MQTEFQRCQVCYGKYGDSETTDLCESCKWNRDTIRALSTQVNRWKTKVEIIRQYFKMLSNF